MHHSVKIGDAIEFEIEDVVPLGSSTGVPAQLVNLMHPAGSELTWRTRSARRSTRSGSVRGQLRILPIAVLLVGMSAADSATLPQVGTERRQLGAALDAARARLGLVALLLALAALAWWSSADRMAGMDAGPGTALGALGWFLGIWVVMMAAMMFPSLAPTAALYTTMTRRHGLSRPLLFTAAYLFVWGAAGLVAYGLFELGASCSGQLAWHSAGRWFAGGVLAVAALYEVTPLKDVCLSKCRSPLGFLLGSWRDGRLGRDADGLAPRWVVLGLLLGADGGVVRAWRHEPGVDGIRGGADRA